MEIFFNQFLISIGKVGRVGKDDDEKEEKKILEEKIRLLSILNVTYLAARCRSLLLMNYCSSNYYIKTFFYIIYPNLNHIQTQGVAVSQCRISFLIFFFFKKNFQLYNYIKILNLFSFIFFQLEKSFSFP